MELSVIFCLVPKFCDTSVSARESCSNIFRLDDDEEEEEGVWTVVMPPRPQWFCVRSRNGDDNDEGDVKADPKAASEAIKTTRQSMEILIVVGSE
jgi:hypothetical protein